MTALSESRLVRKISAPALIRSWRQLAAQKTGVALDKVEVALGDTTLPEGPISGGSMATGSLVPLFCRS